MTDNSKDAKADDANGTDNKNERTEQGTEKEVGEDTTNENGNFEDVKDDDIDDSDDYDADEEKYRQIQNMKKNADDLRQLLNTERNKCERRMPISNSRAEQIKRRKTMFANTNKYLLMTKNEGLYWQRIAEKKSALLKRANLELKWLRYTNKHMDEIIKKYRKVIRHQKKLILGDNQNGSSESQSDSDKDLCGRSQPFPPHRNIDTPKSEKNHEDPSQ